MATSNIRSYIEERQTFEITNVGTLIGNLIRIALPIGALLALGYLIWGGIDWITSEGDKTQYQEARKKITHALIGLAILACTWAFWLLALKFFGISRGESSGAVLDLAPEP